MQEPFKTFLEKELQRLKEGEEKEDDFSKRADRDSQLRLFGQGLEGERTIWFVAKVARGQGQLNIATADQREFFEELLEINAEVENISVSLNVKLTSGFKDDYAIQVPPELWLDFLTA